jgi:enoyl-CoA hydratase
MYGLQSMVVINVDIFIAFLVLLDVETSRELKQAFELFDKDDSLSVAVFSGSGGNFCAGYDLQFLAGVDNTGDMRENHSLSKGPMGPTHLCLTKPVIAAVEGYAVAGMHE